MTVKELIPPSEDPEFGQLWRDPLDGKLRRRFPLGEVCNGRLSLKQSRTGITVYWHGAGEDDITTAFTLELFTTMQMARALAAIRQGRHPLKVYDAVQNWQNEDVYFLMVLTPSRYLLEDAARA